MNVAAIEWRREAPDSPGWWVKLDENGNRGVNWHEGGEHGGYAPKWWFKLPPLPEQHPDPSGSP